MHKISLALCLLTVAALAPGCRGQTGRQPPIHLNLNMDNQTRFDAQEPNDHFPDHRSSRPQVAGTVAMGSLHADPLVAEGRLPDGSWADAVPDAIVAGGKVDTAFLERGRERYDIHCAPCHGMTGAGDGIVVKRGFLPPPNYHADNVRNMRLGYFYNVVKNGVRTMPAYGKQIPTEDRWAIAAYIRVLQASQTAGEGDVPADKKRELK